MGRRRKLSSGEKIAAGLLGVAVFPFVLTLETAKMWDRKHTVHKHRRRK